MNHTDDIENSLDGIRRAEASPYLTAKVLSRLQATAKQLTSPRWVYITASCLILLLALNLVLLIKAEKRGPHHNDAELMARQLGLDNDNPVSYH